MVTVKDNITKVTLAVFLARPETKPAREFFNGYIEQKPMPQGEHSIIQSRLVATINEVALSNKLAHAFSELRCTFGGQSLVPDITVFTWQRIPKTEEGRIKNRFDLPPDWIIEILSPEQSANKVIKKILFALSQGTQLGWLVDPEDESVMIFKPNIMPEIKSGDEVLPVLAVLQDWHFTATEMFAWLSVA
ncbi:Uma2 family endonuclease [Spirulina sp. CS-785/01]|uniref:Uma2 family endonuclease n=1 Tax=Spirulina sp. CS-785/01 TaxID=3021716 RepID=UPI00232F32D5|nr:Uma2 family endonuclease [Spirulina sp. CS-785/01]MDB9313926.1 Uma2 family endonuclease [Spirulina sp. CS-785/01]